MKTMSKYHVFAVNANDFHSSFTFEDYGEALETVNSIIDETPKRCLPIKVVILNENMNIVYNSDKKNKDYKEIRRQKYNTLKENGICVQCAWRPAVEGKIHCEVCRKLRKDIAEKRRRENGVLPMCIRRDKHHCGICCKEIDPGSGTRLCPECYERVGLNMKKAQAARLKKRNENGMDEGNTP